MVNLLIKTAIVYFAVMLSLRVMGKRQLAQLETFDLVTALLISEIASTPLDSPGTPILQGVIPALMLIVLYFLVAKLSYKSRRFSSLVEGRPTVIIKDGVILNSSLADSNYSLGDLTEALRIQGYDDISALDTVILETSGNISVFEKNIEKGKKQSVSLPLVISGKLQTENLDISGITKKELLSKLCKKDVRIKNIFYAALTRDGSLFYQLMSGVQRTVEFR